MLDQLGGRKFILSLIVVAAGIAVSIASPKGLTSELVALLLGVIGVFSGANALVTSKMAGVSEEGSSEPTIAASEPQPAAPAVDLSPIEQRLSQTEMALMAQGEQLAQVGKIAENSAKLAQAALGLKG